MEYMQRKGTYCAHRWEEQRERERIVEKNRLAHIWNVVTTIYVLLTLVCYSPVVCLFCFVEHSCFFTLRSFSHWNASLSIYFRVHSFLIQTLPRDNMHLIKSHTQCSCYVSTSFDSVFSHSFSGLFSKWGLFGNSTHTHTNGAHASFLSLSVSRFDWVSPSHLAQCSVVPLQSISKRFLFLCVCVCASCAFFRLNR